MSEQRPTLVARLCRKVGSGSRTTVIWITHSEDLFKRSQDACQRVEQAGAVQAGGFFLGWATERLLLWLLLLG